MEDWADLASRVITGQAAALVLALGVLVVCFYVIRRLYQDLREEREKRDALHDRMESLLRETRELIERLSGGRSRS